MARGGERVAGCAVGQAQTHWTEDAAAKTKFYCAAPLSLAERPLTPVPTLETDPTPVLPATPTFWRRRDKPLI